MPRIDDPSEKVLAGGLFVLATTIASWHVGAQDALVADLFPGVELSKHLPGAHTELYAASHAVVESDAKEYVALAYYEPYATNLRNRSLSYALLERIGEAYEVRLDQIAADDAASLDVGKPFLYRVASAELIVFSTCYRGCRYRFFRLGTTPIEIPLERYVELGPDESLSGIGDVYRFDEDGLSAAFAVARAGDASCCPSGGTLELHYQLRNNRLEISRAERSR